MRVTSTEVQEIIDTDLSVTGIDAYISAAEEIVTARLGDSTVLGTTQLKEIERWLTAHLIAMSNKDRGARDVDAEGTLDARITYAGKTGMGLNATRYGQMVLVLDTTGEMASSGSKKMFFEAVTSFD